MTNFGWEYVWHCHLLGHEENDMMRPVVVHVPTSAPAPSTLTVSPTSGNGPLTINLSWTDPTPPATSVGNPANEVGYRVERVPGSSGGTFVALASIPANGTKYANLNVPNGTYRYRVVAYNAAGETPSNTVQIVLGSTQTGPTAPSNLTGSAVRITGNTFQDRVTLNWADNSNNETGFQIQRATNINFTGASTFSVGANVTTFSQNVSRPGTYYYRVRAVNGSGNSNYSNVLTVVAP